MTGHFYTTQRTATVAAVVVLFYNSYAQSVQSVGFGWWQHGVMGEELPDATSQTADALMLYISLNL